MLAHTSSCNGSFLQQHLSSNSSELSFHINCFAVRENLFKFFAFNITNILLLLPLCVFILYLGFQQWTRSALSATSHSNCFTYHNVVMELVGVLGCLLSACTTFTPQSAVFLVGYYAVTSTRWGQIFFHVLTCVERYLAVVHPITYLSLRNERGVRIRNFSIGCVWLLCAVSNAMMTRFSIILTFSTVMLSLMVVSFFSLSVLCVLIRPGPGEQARDQQKVDQSKQRASHTIVVILVVLAVRFALGLIWAVLYFSGERTYCDLLTWELWFSLPISLVLPLLFLRRMGKLVWFRKKH